MNTAAKMSTADALAELDAYCARYGKSRSEAAQTVQRWREAVKADKAEKLKSAALSKPEIKTTASDDALIEEWRTEVNKTRAANNARLQYGVGEHMLEIGYGNGKLSPQSALSQAQFWFAEKRQAYDDAVVADAKAFQEYGRAEEQRAVAILREPYPATGIGRKHLEAYDVVPMTDETLAYYAEHYTPQDLMNTKIVQRNMAAATLGTTFTPDEEVRLDAFLLANQLDIVEGSYIAAFKVLVEEQVIRRKPIAWSGPSIIEPKLPEVVERSAPESQHQGRAAEFAQREADTLRDIRMSLGEYLTEIEQHDSCGPVNDNTHLSEEEYKAKVLQDTVIFKLYEDLMGDGVATFQKPITRESVRKSYFYATLAVKGQRASGFTDDEVNAWYGDSELHNLSAEETKRQLAKYGNVSLSRVDKTQELLKDLVSKLGRKA